MVNTKSKSTTNKKSKKLPNAPKRPQSAFLLFSADLRGKEELKNKKLEEQREYISRSWKELEKNKKEEFEKIYKLENEKYKKEYEEYKNSEKYLEDCRTLGIKPKKSRPKSAYNLFVSEMYKKIKSNKLDDIGDKGLEGYGSDNETGGPGVKSNDNEKKGLGVKDETGGVSNESVKQLSLLSFADCTKQLSLLWKGMSEKEKEKYVEMSNEEKRRLKELEKENNEK